MGIKGCLEVCVVVVNNGNYSRTSLFRPRERIIGLFTAHSSMLSVQLVSCIWNLGNSAVARVSPWQADQRSLHGEKCILRGLLPVGIWGGCVG